MKKYTNAFADQLYERKIFSCHPLCMKDEIILTDETHLVLEIIIRFLWQKKELIKGNIYIFLRAHVNVCVKGG